MPKDVVVLLLTAGAVVAVGYLMTRAGSAKSVPASGSPDKTYATEIGNGALPGQPGYGWDYYSNGVAIGPDGSYYVGGKKVWQP